MSNQQAASRVSLRNAVPLGGACSVSTALRQGWGSRRGGSGSIHQCSSWGVPFASFSFAGYPMAHFFLPTCRLCSWRAATCRAGPAICWRYLDCGSVWGKGREWVGRMRWVILPQVLEMSYASPEKGLEKRKDEWMNLNSPPWNIPAHRAGPHRCLSHQ